MDTHTLLSDLKAGVLTLRLNRPARANAFNFEMTSALRQALVNAEQDAQVRCIVLTGQGKVFSSGQDITEMKQYEGDISYAAHLEETYNPLILQIRNMGKPIVAAINGACAGAAFGIALACDVRIAHTNAYFVVGFSGIALAPDSGVSLFLPKLIGLGRAQEMFYTNQPLFAKQAHAWGLVNQVGGFSYQSKLDQITKTLAHGPQQAFTAGKKAFNHAILPNLAEALKHEGALQDELGRSATHTQAVQAFLEKRKPKYD